MDVRDLIEEALTASTQRFHAEAMSDSLAAMDFAVIQREVERERERRE